MADEERLRYTLGAPIENAVKFTREGNRDGCGELDRSCEASAAGAEDAEFDLRFNFDLAAREDSTYVVADLCGGEVRLEERARSPRRRAGTAEARVGDDMGRIGKHEVALVPPMAPHGLRNVGDDVVRVFGTFSSSTVVSAFGRPFEPDGPQVFLIGAADPERGSPQGGSARAEG